MNWSSVYFLLASVGVIQALFISFYLLSLQQGKRLSHIFLALVILGLSLRIGKSVLNHFIYLSPWQRNLGISGMLLIGPSLWIYGQQLFNTHKADAVNYWHFLPFVIFVAFLYWIPNAQNIASYISYWCLKLHWLIYMIWCWVWASQFRDSNDSELLRWYRQIIVGLLLVWLMYGAIFFKWMPYYIAGAILYSLLIYCFTFLLLRRHVWAADKYNSSQVDEAQVNAVMEKVSHLMTVDQVYLDRHLSLSGLAKQAGISERLLSESINRVKRMGFSAYVNHFRLQHAKKLLLNPDYQNQKIAAVAFDSGYGSVTSFNVMFKQSLGLTPSAYRKQKLISDS
ncbi:helix-turn-helix domain-containing protein [Marinicella sp. W31]|uniref:AraC family transcriptional regulator n=1 Tax=Marinicella sp. W31 TaxID=3023713 RepID=UPI00375796C5